MKIKPAEMACHVHDFPDKEEAGNFSAFHGFGREFGGVDTAGGDLGFLVAFSSRRRDRPGMQVLFELSESVVRPRYGRVQIQPAICEALRKNFSQFGSKRSQAPRDFYVMKGMSHFTSWDEVNQDGLWLFPV